MGETNRPSSPVPSTIWFLRNFSLLDNELVTSGQILHTFEGIPFKLLNATVTIGEMFFFCLRRAIENLHFKSVKIRFVGLLT